MAHIKVLTIRIVYSSDTQSPAREGFQADPRTIPSRPASFPRVVQYFKKFVLLIFCTIHYMWDVITHVRLIKSSTTKVLKFTCNV